MSRIQQKAHWWCHLGGFKAKQAGALWCPWEKGRGVELAAGQPEWLGSGLFWAGWERLHRGPKGGGPSSPACSAGSPGRDCWGIVVGVPSC